MELILILSGIVLFTPLVFAILKSLNLLGTQPGNYYDFAVIFKNVKPWTVAVYLVIVTVLSFVVFFVIGIPVANLPA